MKVSELNATHIGEEITVSWRDNSLTGVLSDIQLHVEEEVSICRPPRPYVTGITLRVGHHQIYLSGSEGAAITE